MKMNNLETSVRNSKYTPDTRGHFRPLDKGWSWVIMLASFGTFFIIGANTYGIGLIHSALLQRFEESVSLTSWAVSVQTSLFYFAGPLSSFVVDKFSCRAAVMLSGIFTVFGYFGTAFASNIQTAIFACGILAGLGSGLGYSANVVVIGFNFERKRNIALGISLSGMGAGLFALAPLMQFALDYYGPVGFFIIQATISLNLVTFGAMYFPSKLELDTQEKRKNRAREDTSKIDWIIVLRLYCRALMNKPIVLLSASMLLNSVGSFCIFLFLPTYVVFKGFSANQAAYMVSLTGILSVFGRLLTGYLANLKTVREIWLYSGTLCAVAVASLIYPFVSDALLGHIVFAVFLGLFSGSCYVLMTPVSIYIVGIDFLSSAIGVQFFFGGFGAILGPVCAGFLVDNGGSYKHAMLFSGVCVLLAAVLSALAVCFPVKNKNRRKDGVSKTNGRETEENGLLRSR